VSRENYVFYKDVEEEIESDAVEGGSYTKTDTVLWWYTECSEEFAERIEDKYDNVWKQKVEFSFAYLDRERVMEDVNSSRSDFRNRVFGWKLDEEEENRLFDAVCDRYSLSYGIEDKGYFDYQPHPDPDYDFKIRVKKWTAHRTKVHIGKARFDEDEDRWIVAYDQSSRWA
jgi:hypothetical protein